jgi:hypothetical protein
MKFPTSTKGIEMTMRDPIRRVSVVSTGHVQIRPEHEASTWHPTALWLLASRTWTGPKPINAYVIEHRDGLVLFDTGQDRASVTEPDYFPGGITKVLYDRLAQFEFGPQETLRYAYRAPFAVGVGYRGAGASRACREYPSTLEDPDGFLHLAPDPGDAKKRTAS